MIAALQNTQLLSGMRILLVEDNFLVGTAIKSLLEDFGCVVVGPASSIDQAKSMVAEQIFDGAVLDINIIGGTTTPVAEELQSKGCPFIFVTGYGSPKNLPKELLKVRRLNKPVVANELCEAIASDFV